MVRFAYLTVTWNRCLIASQMGSLMLIFGIGYFAIFLVFVLLHLHAYRRREQLELNRWNDLTRLAAFKRAD